jgi:endonuclease-3 related protein
MVGAILTQNTAWRNVEKAIDNLRANKLLSAEAIDQAPQSVLEAIRPSGYYNVKGKRLFSLVKFILANGRGGQRPQILDWPMETLRPALLSVNGIGPETADCILLYAALQPSFVVDLYTRRLLSRHGLALGHEPYEEIRAWFMRSLPSDVKLYNEFHALIVAAGHHNCYPRSPKCPVCPLRDDPLLSLS